MPLELRRLALELARVQLYPLYMKSPKLLSWLIVFASLLAAPGSAQPARLVEDLAPGTLPADVRISSFLPVGSRSVFVRSDDEHRLALWVTDGTAEGTSPLGVLCPPCESVVPLGSTGSIAFYRVGYSGFAIWRTDGTPAGTFPVTSELSPPSTDPPRLLAALSGGLLFFNACSPELGCELWSTDGSGATPAGEIVEGPESGEILELASAGGRAFLITGLSGGPTVLWLADAQGLKQLLTVPDARSLAAQGNRAFFAVGDREVWTSDGTAAGTRRVTELPRQPSPRIGGLTLLDGRAYFTANSRRGRELWSVGPRLGSQRVLASIRGPYAWVGEMEKSGNRIVFVASGSDGSKKLWSSRGSFQSTAQLTGCPGGCPHVYGELTPVAPGRFVFHGQSQEGAGIWVTDGTAAGTRLLQETGLNGLTQAVQAGGRVLILVTEEYEVGELWITDGTVAGTFLAARGGPTLSHYWGWSGALAAGGANGRLVFPGFRDSEDFELVLWSSDGSREGSRPIVEPRTARGSHPYQLTPFRDGLLAWTCSGEVAELRFAQGTETTLLQSQETTDCPSSPYPPVVLGDAIALFLRYDGLWRTDGTPEGTQTLFTDASGGYPYALARFGDEAAFTVSTQSGDEIWLTDGTPQGTRKHLELPAETDTLGLTFAGGRLWFFDLILLPSNEVVLRPWVSDGTPAGTQPLIAGHGLMPLRQFYFAEAGGRVYFPFAGNGEALAIWGSDGTPAGTGPVVTAESGAGAPETLAAIGDRLYFTAPRTDGPAGRLLPWVSDGTDGSTELLADVTVGEASFAPVDRFPFVELNGRVWFAAADRAHGDELWSTDGTPEGTARLLDIAPGLLGSHPRGLTVWNGRLWFRARDGVHGMEPWSSDGTVEGTRLVQDINPGASWSTPRELTAAEGGLYFSAADGEHGRELWVVQP